MVNKLPPDNHKRILFIGFLFMLVISVWFPSARSPLLAALDANYRIDIRYIQRLTWVGDEHAFRYEVIIERYEEEDYSRFFQAFTENEFIEVSLPAGNYRYQVIPHDFFGTPIPVIDWVEFEVLRAAPSFFGSENFQFVVSHFDIYTGVFWVPLFPFYNMNFFTGENMSLICAELRFGMVYAGQKFINPGMELGGSWRMIDEAQLITIDLKFLGQIPFINGKMALNIRAGAGISLLSDTQSESMPNLAAFHVNMGISFIAFVTRNLYMELGADTPQFLSVEHYGFLRPWIGIGVKF